MVMKTLFGKVGVVRCPLDIQTDTHTALHHKICMYCSLHMHTIKRAININHIRSTPSMYMYVQ